MEIVDASASPEYALLCIKWCAENQETKALKAHLKLHKDILNDELIPLLLNMFTKRKVLSVKTMLSEMDEEIKTASYKTENAYLLHKLLCSAVELGNSDIVKDVIDKGANVNRHYNGKPILHFAASQGQTDVVTCLIEAGADVNGVDKRGDNVVHTILTSQLQNKVDAVRLVVTHGASPHDKSSTGKLPIHIAAKNAPEVLHEILQDGVDVNIPDDINNETPLHIACGSACRETILTLIQSGSRFNAENRKGLTPLSKLLQFTNNDHDFHTKTRLGIAKVLISIGFRIRKIRGPTAHTFNKGRDKIYDRYVLIKLSLNSPPRLQSLARLTVRESLTNGKRLTEHVDNLDIPVHLKSYIMFKDLNL